MTKKRLTFNVEESLHNRLKAEAAALGVPLGSYCESILDGRPESSGPSSIKKFDVTEITTMSLNSLRELSVSLTENKPTNWRTNLSAVNTEIRRRYRV